MTLPALATVEDVELFTGSLGEDDVARVSRWLDMASAAVRRYTRQTLTLVEDDEVTIPSTGTTLLVLGQRPVRAVNGITVEFLWGEWPGESGPPSTRAGWADPGIGRFTWDAYGRLQRLDGLTWGTRFDPVSVVYTHGFDPVPDDITGLVAAKVANYMASLNANPEGLKSLQVGAMSQTFSNPAGSAASTGPAALSEAEQDTLADYRQRAFAVDIRAQ